MGCLYPKSESWVQVPDMLPFPACCWCVPWRCTQEILTQMAGFLPLMWTLVNGSSLCLFSKQIVLTIGMGVVAQLVMPLLWIPVSQIGMPVQVLASSLLIQLPAESVSWEVAGGTWRMWFPAIHVGAMVGVLWPWLWSDLTSAVVGFWVVY